MSKKESQNWTAAKGKKAVSSGKNKEDIDKENFKKINEENFEEAFREAANLYMLGVGGDKEAVKDAIGLLKKLHSYDPEDHVVEAYYGSALALIGRDAPSPVEKFKNTNNGLKMLDHAVISEPTNIEIRNLRANVGFKLPEMYFHRTGMAIEDFLYIASRYEEDDTVFAPNLYWQTLFNIGSAFKTLGYTQDAHSAWDKLLSVTTDTTYNELLSKEGYKKD